MPAPFDSLAARVPDGGWSTVVWAGIGYGDGLEALHAQGMQQLVALEPQPRMAAWLAASPALGTRDNVRQVALWSQGGDQRLFVLNDPLQSGLSRPEHAMAVRRNLTVESEVVVRATTLDALCESMADDVQRLLVLDVNGAEEAILGAAADATLLGFAAIAVHVDPLHVADAIRGALTDGLAARGFQPVPDPTDADWDWLVVARAPDGLPKTALQEEVATLTARIGELVAALSTSEQSAQRATQLEADLQQTRQTMRMAVQMQAQREADLADLQARYRDGQDALERQHALLDKLGERLGLASDYFHQLSASADNGQPSVDGPMPDGGSGDGRTGRPRRGSGTVRKAAKPKPRG